MARPASSRLQGLVTVSGMVAFVGALSMAPRVSIARTEDSIIVKYDRLKRDSAPAPPSDLGVVITPAPLASRTANPDGHGEDNKGKKPFSSTDWIFDTGATTHVCTNRALLHSYVTLNPFTSATASSSARPVAVGHFGPNPVPIVGVGDCTFVLPALSPSSSSSSSSSFSSTSPPSALSLSLPLPSFAKSKSTATNTAVVDSSSPLALEEAHPQHTHPEAIRLTLGRVMHIPSAGVNLISWSQLKRSKGFNTQLVEEADGSLTVRDRGTQKALMRFVLKGGLYVLVQEPIPLNQRHGTGAV